MACFQSRIILFEESTKSTIVYRIKKSYINAEIECSLVTSCQYAMRFTDTDQRKDVDDHTILYYLNLTTKRNGKDDLTYNVLSLNLFLQMGRGVLC